MTKVEELREMILHWNRYSDVPHVSEQAVDSLISAAHAEGVAEGAERERERIRKLASLIDEGFPEPMYLIHPSVLIAPVIIEQLMGRILEAVVNNGDAALRETASVLAPTKK